MTGLNLIIKVAIMKIHDKSAIDPITVEIVSNGLRSIADETFVALMKSAYSTNIKERRDHSTVICDRRGRLVVQAEASLPIHIASMTGLMQHVLARFGDDIEEGDIFIANDPHAAGGTHLPDINMAMPVFHRKALVGFMCNIAHHADVGGMVPGSMAGGMSEIYQEGLRLPVVKLFRKGRAAAGPARPHPSQRADPARAARRLFRADRRLPPGGTADARNLRDATATATMLSAYDEIIARTRTAHARRGRDEFRTGAIRSPT